MPMKTSVSTERPPGSTRRQFLRGTAAFAAAAAFPRVVPARALGAGGAVAPSERLTLGIIGLGKLGRESHLSSYLGKSQVQVVALNDVETGRLEQSKRHADEVYAKAYGEGKYASAAMYTDFRELLARNDIDAVVIATPDHWHAIPSIEAAKVGKHVYCEKPMTRTIAEGRAVVTAARRYNIVFQTGSQQRSDFAGRFRKAVELVRNGAIGSLQSIDIGVGGPPGDAYDLKPEPVPPTLDWDFWQGPAPWREYNSELCPLNYPGFPNWRNYRDYAGGSLSDFGAHHFDIAQWALDMDHSGPVEVLYPNGKDVPLMTFVYANGVVMYHKPGAEANCVFRGAKGTVWVSRSFLRTDPENLADIKWGPNELQLDRGRDHREDWLECIRTRQKPIADVEIGHRTNSVCQLANIGYVVKRDLKWDPVQEQFIGDAEANALLSRANRSPWHL